MLIDKYKKLPTIGRAVLYIVTGKEKVPRLPAGDRYLLIYSSIFGKKSASEEVASSTGGIT